MGNIIKKGIELSASLPSTEGPIEEIQKEQLRKILTKAKKTAFGLYHGFEQITSEDDPRGPFADEVPIFDYHEMDRVWWSKQQKHPDITWPGRPDYFALSSGTTGKKSKRIPVSNDMLSSMRKVGIDLVKDLSSFDLPAEVFEKEVFVLSSSADLNKNRHGFEEGEISGINVHNFPGWYDFFYRPGKEIAEIDDWDTRHNRADLPEHVDTETVRVRRPGAAWWMPISNSLISSGVSKGTCTQPSSGSAAGSPAAKVTSGSPSTRV